MAIGKDNSATLCNDEFWVSFNMSGKKNNVAMHDKTTLTAQWKFSMQWLAAPWTWAAAQKDSQAHTLRFRRGNAQMITHWCSKSPAKPVTMACMVKAHRPILKLLSHYRAMFYSHIYCYISSRVTTVSNARCYSRNNWNCLVQVNSVIEAWGIDTLGK